MFHIDHIDGADPFRELERFMLREGLRGEPAFLLFPDDRRIQAFLNRGPDGKIGRKFVTVDGNVRAVADANFIDLVKEVILGITRKDISHTRLDAHAHQGKQTFLFPVFGFLELIVPQFDPRPVEWIFRIWLRQRHRHIHIFRVDVVCRVEKLFIEDRVNGVHDEINIVFPCQSFNIFLFACIHKFNGKAFLGRYLPLHFLSTIYVVIGKHH